MKAFLTSKWTQLSFVLLVVLLLAAVWAYSSLQAFLKGPIATGQQQQVFVINKGDSAQGVAQRLHQQNLLDKPQWFVWYLRYLEKHHLLKAGEFAISPNWRPERLVQELLNGTSVQYPVTIVAGQTFEQTLKVIAKLPKIKRQLDLSDPRALQALFEVEKPINPKYPFANLEGLILPETYHYQQGDSDQQILMRAFNAMQEVLQQAWDNRKPNLPLSSPYEVLILASIVEKETGYAPERPKIAGVFENRLKRKMRLQTDPTIIYGMGKAYQGNIRKKDIQQKTLYNTYQINGLPPTPIAAPSRQAIEAVANPEDTKALFFVAKGGGKHYFSETLAEHNRAVRKYLLSK